MEDMKSAREQAEPYRLATVRFPIDALTYSWRHGTNRSVDETQVNRLCRLFKEHGVQQDKVDHYFRVACTYNEVQRMFDYLRSHGHSIEGASNLIKGPVPWPSFGAWFLRNTAKAELMAGQHRVEAFKRYLRQTADNRRTCTTEWVCDLYDIGIIPILPVARFPLR